MNQTIQEEVEDILQITNHELKQKAITRLICSKAFLQSCFGTYQEFEKEVTSGQIAIQQNKQIGVLSWYRMITYNPNHEYIIMFTGNFLQDDEIKKRVIDHFFSYV